MDIATRSRWQVAPAAAGPDAAALGISPVLARLLGARGLADTAAARRYLDRSWTWRDHHWAWPALVTATERLITAIASGEPIAIYGDYDVDGVTSSAVLYGFLKGLGADVISYLPHRLHDGYGLSIPALDSLAAMGRRLVITVDNGVSAVKEVAHANAIGLEVIITDHHTPPAVLPKPLALMNPRCFDPELGVLAGVGVAYLLCLSLQRRLGRGDADQALDIVAIGTVADQAPLTGINRHLVQRGLTRLETSRRPGLLALLSRAGVDPWGPLTAREIGFVIGPRLNAAGRLEHPQIAVDLLLTDCDAQAAALAEHLEALNHRRRRLTDEMTDHAQTLIRQECNLEVDRCLTLWSPSWHHGISGIVAARLTEQYQRPVLLLCQDGEVWKGSGRSPAWIDLHGLLQANQDHLLRFGGHRQAAGCTVADGDRHALRHGLNRALREGLDDVTVPPLAVDLVVPLAAVTPELLADLERLEPLGQANPAPRLATAGVTVLEPRLRGARGSTLIATVSDGVHGLRAIGMQASGLLPLPERADLVYTPEWHTFRAERHLQLRLHAIGGVHEALQVASSPESTPPAPSAERPVICLDQRQMTDRPAVLRRLLAEGRAVAVWAAGAAVDRPTADGLCWAVGEAPLPPAATLVLWDRPARPDQVTVGLEATGAGRLCLLWPPETAPAPITAGMLNAIYRQLKTMVGQPLVHVRHHPWPEGPGVFDVLWQALREAGLVLQHGTTWHLLRPSGERIAAMELPAIKAYERTRLYQERLGQAVLTLAELVSDPSPDLPLSR